MIGKTGIVSSWTVIRMPPADYGYQAPYPVVLVKLDGGESIVAQMVDYESGQLVIGQRVVTVVRRTVQSDVDDVIVYGIKVKPL